MPDEVAYRHVAFSFVVSERMVEVVPRGSVLVGDPLLKMGGVLSTVTVMADDVATLLFISVVDAMSVWDPSVEDAVFHEIVYGDEVTTEPSFTPSSKNWTDEMPTVEVGFAVTEIVVETVAPFVGAVMETAMPVAFTVSVTEKVRGEPVAATSAMVAVALYVPAPRPVGFAMKRTEVLAFDARELEVGEKVSHD
jgi:hypothetical protein